MSLKKLGRYDLIRVLGKGAMGLVYEGRDPNLDRRVAIKTIKVENLSEEAAAEYEVRFRTEARSAARLQHPHIVSVYDSDRDGDIAFLVMEFIAGDDLKHHLDKGDLYSLEQTLGIMGDLLSALDYAHRQSIVHRDIKPANLLIETNGRVKLTDFGVARIQDSGEATRTQGSMVGTLKYMSPEQVQGRPIDARADLFAAGIVLYQLLTGKRPFDGDTDFATIQQIVGHAPALPSAFNAKLPPALDAVVAKALAKSRDLRYASAQEFLTALQAAAREASDTTVLPPAVKPGPGSNSTWTSTMLAGEALVDQPSGTSANISVVTQELELVYWKDIKESMDVEDIQGFLVKFPSGIYADLARRRLKKMGASGGEDSDIGTRLGTGTLIVPRPGSQPAGSMPGTAGTAQGGNTDTAWKALEEAAAQVPVAPFVPPTPAADDPDATRLGTPVIAAAAQPAPKAAAPDESFQSTQSPESSEWPETVFSDAHTGPAEPEAKPPAVEAPSPKPAKPPKAAKPVKTADVTKAGEAALAAAVKADSAKSDRTGAALKSGTKTTGTAKPAMPRNLVWGAAGIAALVVIGIGFKFFSGSGTPPAEPSAVQAAPAADSAPATPAVPVAPEPVVQAAAQAQAPAPAASQAAVPLSPASRAALALAAANRKTALEKERQAKQAAQAKPGTATAAPAAAEHAATTAPAAASGGGPRQACEGRILLGFQACMTEQCAKPAFTNYPVCVERRAMEQRRREAEQFSR
jgi:serine/threonine protein kinase